MGETYAGRKGKTGKKRVLSELGEGEITF